MPSVFLVMATAKVYEHKPPIPLRVFSDRAQAEKWLAKLIDYHVNRPEMPYEDDRERWKAYDAQLEAWRSVHPAGAAASHYQQFGVHEVPFAQ
ncbi:TPA: hypothetical protein ACKQHR_001377 [Pseudomonas aeruginosa]|nr:hypothetical protein [Pseudomonas aeruginosa]